MLSCPQSTSTFNKASITSGKTKTHYQFHQKRNFEARMNEMTSPRISTKYSDAQKRSVVENKLFKVTPCVTNQHDKYSIPPTCYA